MAASVAVTIGLTIGVIVQNGGESFELQTLPIAACASLCDDLSIGLN